MILNSMARGKGNGKVKGPKTGRVQGVAQRPVWLEQSKKKQLQQMRGLLQGHPRPVSKGTYVTHHV